MRVCRSHDCHVISRVSLLQLIVDVSRKFFCSKCELPCGRACRTASARPPLEGPETRTTTPFGRLLSGLALLAWGSDVGFDELFADQAPVGPPVDQDSVRVFRQSVFFNDSNSSFFGRFFDRMVLRKWNHVYVKTSPRAGVVMMLIEKVIAGDPQDMGWTAVDSALRVQVVNLRNRAVYTLKKIPGVNYSPMVALTTEQKQKIEDASFAVIKRAGGDPTSSFTINVEKNKPRARAFKSFMHNLSSAGIMIMSYRALGFWASLMVLGWRIANFTGMTTVVYNTFWAIREVIHLGDDLAEVMSELRTMHQEGQFDLLYIIASFMWVLVFFWACRSSAPDDLPDRGLHSPPLSPRTMGTDASDAESEEEVDPRIKSLQESQAELIRMMRAMQANSASTSSAESSPRPAPTSGGSLSHDNEVLAGVDRLIERMQKTESMVNDDRGPATASTKAEAGSLPPGDAAKRSSLGGPPGLVPGADSNGLTQVIERLEKEATNPREAALQHLRRFQQVENFVVGGDAKVRIAPTLIAKLYKSGRTAVKEMEETLRTKGLEKCHTAAELPTLALVLDRLLLLSSEADVINMPAVEAVCRRMYGLIRAFEDVQRESDWQRPKNAQGKWKSKVKWQLLEEYDVKALESNEYSIPAADEEVSQRLRQKALFAKHLSPFNGGDGAAEGPKE